MLMQLEKDENCPATSKTIASKHTTKKDRKLPVIKDSSIVEFLSQNVDDDIIFACTFLDIKED
jgi:hypothetical protein